MEQPVLRLGLLGFPAADYQKIQQAIGQLNGAGPWWELVEFEQADAWCVNGASIEQIRGNTVMVRTQQPLQPLVSLDPGRIDRPIAFTEPLPEDLVAAELVNFQSTALLQVGLQRFEAWLRHLRVQFVLGCELVSRQNELSQGVYHVIDLHGKLLAVANLKNWTVATLTSARPVDFEEASWVHRPGMAADVPASFISNSVAKLMWNYAVRTRLDPLPERYRKETIYLRKLPNLPVGWLRDEHLVLLRALSSGPGKFADFLRKTDLPDSLLARALAALYFAGAITTKKSASMQVEKVASPIGSQSSLPPDSHMFMHNRYQTEHRSGVGSSFQYLKQVDHLDETAPVPLFDFKPR